MTIAESLVWCTLIVVMSPVILTIGMLFLAMVVSIVVGVVGFVAGFVDTLLK